MGFSTGFDNYDQDLKEEEERAPINEVYPFSLKTNESKDVIILDDTGTRFFEHSFFNQADKKGANFACKDKEPGGCFMCTDVKKRPALITVMTVKDMAGYTTNSGEIKGVGQVKPFKLKKNAAKRIQILRQSVAMQKAQNAWSQNNATCLAAGHDTVEKVAAAIIKKGGVLKNTRVRCSRIGEKSEASGDDFQLVSIVKQEELGPMDVPFDYNVQFAFKSDDVIKSELSQIGINVTSANLGQQQPMNNNQGFNGNQQQGFQGNQPQVQHQVQQSNQAPSFNESEEIPF